MVEPPPDNIRMITNSISGVTEKVDGNPYHVLISQHSASSFPICKLAAYWQSCGKTSIFYKDFGLEFCSCP